MFVNMDRLRLSDLEQRVYEDLFNQCDVENTGKVSGFGAGHLFISSGLSQEVLNQITDVCGAKRLGHFGRYNFYVALKLIAAAQVGLPIMVESFSSGQDLPLPTFGVQQTNTGKLVGMGCDGASNMLGCKSGVATLLKLDYPEVISVHCLCHRLELAFRDATKSNSTNYSKMMTVLIGLHYMYKKSFKQKQALRNTWQALNMTGTFPPKVTGTRWLGHISGGIRSLLRNFKSYEIQLATASHENAKAEGLLKILLRKEVMAFILLLEDLLDPLVRFSAKLQREYVTLADAITWYEATLESLESCKTRNSEALSILLEAGTYDGVQLKGSKPALAYRKKLVDSLIDAMETRFHFSGQDVIMASILTDLKKWPQTGSEDIEADHRRVKSDQDPAQNDRKPSLGNSQIQPPPKHSRSHQIQQRNSLHGHDGPASPPISPTDGTENFVKQPNVGPAVLPNQMNAGPVVQHGPASQMNLGAGSVHVPTSNMHHSVGPGIVPTNQMHSGPGSGHMPTNQFHPGGASSSHNVTNQVQGGVLPEGVSPHFDYKQGLDKEWASFEDSHDNEDNQGLLTNETKEWAHFTDSSSKHDTSSISSEADSVEDVWSITDEQREYYINQFKTMQPDVRGVISGAVAKEFFEKSKLPVVELSKIWQLSDVNRDGALSLEEFCTAMHLVVLRRNDIELPEHLPPALMPYVPLNPEEPFAADLPPGSTIRKMSPTPPSPAPQPPSQWMGTYSRGQESPTSSSVSSPGSKPTPVNFDYTPIIADAESKIVHPVALRMSPDGLTMPLDGTEGTQTEGGENEKMVVSPTMEDPGFPAGGQSLPTFVAGPIQGRPRPTPKKSQSVPGPAPDYMAPQPRLLPPPSSQDHSTAGGDRPVTLPVVAISSEMAPLPPPRPKSGHSRSSSLDNQLIDFSDRRPDRELPCDLLNSTNRPDCLNQTMPPPAVPPRAGNKEGVAFSEGDLVAASGQDSKMPGTPPGYHKDRPGSRDDMEPYTSTPAKYLVRENSADKDLRDLVRKQRLRNMTLSRVNNELNEELQEMMEQRIALEIQYEHLRPFHS